MPSVTRYPTTNAVATTGWTNPGNAYASDDSYATAVPGTNSTISSYFGGFDFASYVPEAATIVSVIIYFERKFSTAASTASIVGQQYDGSTAIGSLQEDTSEPTYDVENSFSPTNPTTAQLRSSTYKILIGAKRGTGATGYTGSLDMVKVTVSYTVDYVLTAEQGSISLTGQVTALLAARLLTAGQGSFALTGQDITLTYTPGGGGYTLTCDAGSFALSGQDALLLVARVLSCEQGSITLDGQAAALLAARLLAAAQGSYTLDGQTVTFVKKFWLQCDAGEYAIYGQTAALLLTRLLTAAQGSYTLTGVDVVLTHVLYEGGEDMITFGTLLTRIQSALGDTAGTTWVRATTVWQFAQDALREFPILRPKSSTHEIITGEEHGFTLPNDFRSLVYVEYPISQYPPEYLTRKSHLDSDFYDLETWCDVERDFDSGSYHKLFTSAEIAIGSFVIVRYMAAHTFEFSSESTAITVENQYVQILINHVVYMAFKERLAIQLQDPTAHTSTIQQMSDACATAEKRYIDSLNTALTQLTSSERVSGWKVDRFDRIY